MADTNMDYKIAAVVVTYNRLTLLQECVESLRNQTRKLDEIIIVNNSSTDGTIEWLNKQEDLTVITQENSGSAGGQHTGLKTAYEKGYDWIWCMDDDCRLDKNALKLLCDEVNDEVVVLNCLPLSSSDNEKLSFGLYDSVNKIYHKSLNQIKKNHLFYKGSFFVGCLIHQDIVKSVGLPIIDLVIRGEEVEYMFRIERNGFKLITITNSIIYHPPSSIREMNIPFFFHEFEYLDAFKRYHFSKNSMYLMRKYRHRTIKNFAKILILDLMGILIYQKDIKIFSKAVRGYIIGIFINPKIEFIK